MTDRPILFSAPMVRALLDGTKTQTRRLIKNPYHWGCPTGDCPHNLQTECNSSMASLRDEITNYRVGDRLWVKETHAYVGSCDPGYLLFRASDFTEQCDRHGFDKPYPPVSEVKWTPSIFMRRKASRITLAVTEVRVERLQDISEPDALAEGIMQYGRFFGLADSDWDDAEQTASAAYHRLWDSINGPDAWEMNPWIVAITFDVEQRNIDR